MKPFLISLLTIVCLYTADSQELKVMTYNIRLDYSGDGKNTWEERKEHLANQVLFYEPDVLGIQEGLPNQVAYLDDKLAGYSYVGVGREDGKSKGEFSAIFYKNDFQLVRDSTLWLSETPEKPSTGWDAALPRICTYALLKKPRFDQTFMVFNAHFDHVGDTARYKSMELILNQMKAINDRNIPVILMGDFNAVPGEKPIEIAKRQLTDARAEADILFGPEATFNGFAFDQPPERRLDYIFVSDDLSVTKYAVLTDSYALKYISDHFAVLAILSFND